MTPQTYTSAIIDSLRGPILLLDPDLRVVLSNRAFHRMFELRLEETHGRSIDELGTGPWNLPALRDMLQRILEGNTHGDNLQVDQEFPAIGRRIMLLDARRLNDGPSPGSLILLAIEDITDRCLAQRALQSSEEFNRSLMEASPDCVKVLDFDGRLEHMNGPGLVQMEIDDFGPLCGAHWWNLWPAGATAQIHQAIAKAQQGIHSTFQAFCPTAKGTPKWWEVSVNPIRDGAGNIVQLLSVSRDITETRLAGDKLRDTEARWRMALDSAELGAWNIDPAANKLESDTRFRIIFSGVDRPITYEEAFAMIHPEDRQSVRDAVAAAVDPKNPASYLAEYRVVHPDGSIHWIYAKGRANFQDQGAQRQLKSFDGTVMDITARKETDRRILEARDAAEAANHSKDKFLAVLSHELRTPLAPVMMTIPALERDPELPPKFREDLAMLRRNIDLEVKLIDDLLDVSRVISGKLHLQIQSVNAHELLLHTIHNCMSEVSAKHLTVTKNLAAANDCLRADPARLQQVFWNLLRNAVKFTPEKGAINITTWNSDDDRLLLIEIEDSGVGIPPENLGRIFDAFDQGDAHTTRQFGGLGLGLAIAKAVVEIHGGAITVASDGAGKGARFRVTLHTSPRPLPQEACHPNPAANPAAGFHSRILLVEDHSDTARVLTRLLKLEGYHVVAAACAADALQCAAAENFDIVISDIGLPDATGYELMREIAARFGIKGIALTGYGMEDDMRQSRDAGFVDHIVKPVNIAQLLAVIQRVSTAHKSPS